MVLSQTPAISAAAIQLILLAIAFKITSCSFIIRSSSAAETFSGVVKLQHPAAFQNRTTHVLIGPDNSHASDTRPYYRLTLGTVSHILHPIRHFRSGVNVNEGVTLPCVNRSWASFCLSRLLLPKPPARRHLSEP